MTVTKLPKISKKEDTGVLTPNQNPGNLPKHCIIGIIILVILLHGCTTQELIAQPLSPTTKASLAEKQTITNETTTQAQPPKNTTPHTPTAAIMLDSPQPTIHPIIEKEIKTKRKNERIKVLVEAENNKALQELADAVESAGGTVTHSFSIGNIAVIEIPAEKISEIAQQEGVQQISPEREYVAFLQDRIPAFSIDTTAWANNITGTGTTIAILDTGIGPHNAVTVTLAKSFVTGEDPSDQNGHGTHVAGIAQGIAPGTRLLNAKVLSKSGTGTTSSIIAGINWATDPDNNPETDDGADIISMSFGGMFTDPDGPLASAVKEAISLSLIHI